MSLLNRLPEIFTLGPPTCPPFHSGFLDTFLHAAVQEQHIWEYFLRIIFASRLPKPPPNPREITPKLHWTAVLSHFLPVPALLAGRGVFVHESGEFEQREFLQQEELGDGLVLHSWTGGKGGQALFTGPVQLLAHSAGNASTQIMLDFTTETGTNYPPEFTHTHILQDITENMKLLDYSYMFRSLDALIKEILIITRKQNCCSAVIPSWGSSERPGTNSRY